jgi:hypothetical protein
LDRHLWRTGFGRSYGHVVEQNKWMTFLYRFNIICLRV